MTPARTNALAVDRVCLTVPALDVAEAFYRDAFGCVRVGGVEPCAGATYGVPNANVARLTLRLGAQLLDLLAFDPPGRSYPADSTASDLWFQHCAIVVRDMGVAYAHIQRFPIAPITQGGPQLLPPNTGSVTAFKFRDPFGHPFELLQFPAGVGNALWHRPEIKDLFLGIDHTAIAVGDVGRSRAFYEGLLGFAATSHSNNTGPAQALLDDIENVRVAVVGLSAPQAPPHLELLGYDVGTRRPRPADMSASDLAVSRTIVEVAGLRAARNEIWCALEDPDGHRLILKEKQ